MGSLQEHLIVVKISLEQNKYSRYQGIPNIANDCLTRPLHSSTSTWSQIDTEWKHVTHCSASLVLLGLVPEPTSKKEEARIMVPQKTGQQMKDKFIGGLTDTVFNDVKIHKIVLCQNKSYMYILPSI